MQAVLKPAPESVERSSRRTELIVLEGGADVKKTSFVPSRDAIIIGASLAILQILDGILTHMGIARFGMQAEYNVFLREMMTMFDPATVLAVLKLSAVVIIAFLTIMTSKYRWVKGAMASLSFLYLVVAVIPWVVLLFFHNPA